jgi:hypothetical protein
MEHALRHVRFVSALLPKAGIGRHQRYVRLPRLPPFRFGTIFRSSKL